MTSKTPLTPLTLRNKLPLGYEGQRAGPTYSAMVDSIYEIADAELNSDKSCHDEFNRLRKKHATYRKSLCKFFKLKITAIARRENFVFREPDGRTVTEAIADNWIKQADPIEKEESHE